MILLQPVDWLGLLIYPIDRLMEWTIKIVTTQSIDRIGRPFDHLVREIWELLEESVD
jgi:hypothetical protein